MTQTRTLVIGLTVTLMMLGTLGVRATVVRADPSIDSFWAKFKAAVIKGDKESIANMSQFPITMPYGIPSVKSRAQLLKRYREVFNRQADAAKCFGESSPEVDAAIKSRFTVGCKDAAGNEVVIYGFVRTRGVWKFKSLDNINE
jgi:hypothetical protein